MRQSIVFIPALILVSMMHAQSPMVFQYQAVIRDNAGNLITGQDVNFRIDILEGAVDGTTVYSETHSAITTTLGIVNLAIGNGTTSDDFSTIDWEDGSYFIKLWVDGNEMGTTQLLSVPYALHARTAETVSGEIPESDPLFTASPAGDIAEKDLINLGNLSGVNSGDQDLSGFARSTALQDTAISIRGDMFSGNYEDLDNRPQPWDSTYSSLKNIPDLTVYATRDMENERISNLGDPIEAQDAVTKSYVDALEARIEVLMLEQMKPTDYDGNIYEIVKIGDQVWMAENLRTTRYADGTPIPNVDDRSQNGSGADNVAWAALDAGDTWSEAAYCWYNNDSLLYFSDFGALYSWAAAMGAKEGASAISSDMNPSGVQGVCPDGWHLPSYSEWLELYTFLASDGHSGAEGTALKATSGWDDFNGESGNGTDAYGFNAIPSGARHWSDGGFQESGTSGKWWSSTEYDNSNSYMSATVHGFGGLPMPSLDKSYGFSVRCVKN